jgi:hypothetical protein
MSVDYDSFLDWAYDRFGEENIKIRGDEICTHSFFAKEKGIEDHKYHLWMNPSGGKKQLEGGAYRCWYTNRMGCLISLVSEYDRISYDEASELICDVPPLRVLEKRVHDFFRQKEQNHTPIVEDIPPQSVPEYSFLIEKMSATSFYRQRALDYLNSRKLPAKGLYVCTEGKYKNRIIIPYYDKNGELVYYNGRTLSDNPDTLRYMKADNPLMDQTKVLYFTHWPRPGRKIHICEGEFDAITLAMSGFVGVACGGKELSPDQVELIRPYIPVLCFDTDGPGRYALRDHGNKLLSEGFSNVSYVRPPVGYKDWNALLVKRDSDVIKEYINKHEKTYSSWTETVLRDRNL